MIIPDKHCKLSNSLIGVGAIMLKNLEKDNTVSSLWYKVRTQPEISNFERFTLTLDFLFIIGAIEFNEGLLRRTNR
jgi:hypothetical protein